MNFRKRLAQLEAHPALARAPAPEPTDAEHIEMICGAFRVGWLRMDAGGAVVAGENCGELREWATTAAALLNRLRRQDDGTLAPLLPLTTDDATTAAAMLRRGWLRLADQSYCGERGAVVAAWHWLQNHDYAAARDAAAVANVAISVYLATGGDLPITTDAIAELLDTVTTVERIL